METLYAYTKVIECTFSIHHTIQVPLSPHMSDCEGLLQSSSHLLNLDSRAASCISTFLIKLGFHRVWKKGF